MNSQKTLEQDKKKNIFSLVGIIFMLPALWVWGAWIKTVGANPSLPQDEKVEIFLGYFPSFIRTVGVSSYMVLLSCAACIVFSAIGLSRATKPFKIVGIIVIVLASLITLLQLFTMM